MPNQQISTISVPIEVAGQIQQVQLDLVDSGARQMISDLGNALYWVGVTTTALSDGDTTNPITVNGQSVTVKTGAMAQYDGDEYVWNGSAWQFIGQSNFGALAFVDTATGSYTPAGTISGIEIQVTPTTTSIAGINSVGSLPTFTLSGTTLTYTAGTLPQASNATTVVTDVSGSATGTPTFTGTPATITVGVASNQGE